MQGKQFLYFIQNKALQFATFSMGYLQWAGTPTPLTFTPNGWQDISILTEKNKNYFGLDRTYGAPQGFVEDAAGILKTIFYTLNSEDPFYLVIVEKKILFTDTNFGFYYDLLCKCEIDISTIEHEGETVTASILDGDLARALKANESTVYDIPINVPQVKYLWMDGIKLFATSHYLTTEYTITEEKNSAGAIPITFINKEGDQVNVLNTTANPGRINGPAASFLGNLKQVNTYHIKQQIAWEYKTSFLLIFNLVVYNTKGDILRTIITNDHGGTQSEGARSGTDNYEFDITLNPDEYLGWVYILAGPVGGANQRTIAFHASPLDITYSSRLSAFLLPCLHPKYVFQQLMCKILNSNDTVIYDQVYADTIAQSGLLDNLVPFCLMSSGDGSRLIPGAYIKTSFKDFFQWLNMMVDAGFGTVSGQYRIEDKQFWANATNPIILQAPSGLKTTLATDYRFSNFKIGWPNKLDDASLGDINGKYEFNITQQWITPDTRSQASLDLTSVYVTGMYAITNIILNSAGKTTTDGDGDNDVLVFNTLKMPTGGGQIMVQTLVGPVTITLPIQYALDRVINVLATQGLLDFPSAFNVNLSPKSCLLRVGAYIRSCLTGLDSSSLVLTSADKDVDVIIGEREERAPVVIGSLAAPYFKSFLFEFTCQAPDTFELANPVRKFMVPYPGNVNLSGFDIKTGTNPADDRQQVFQLLCGPEVDLSQLINVWE